MLYLCRNTFPDYYEFEYDYVVVNGDGVIESAYNRRAFVPPTELCDEYLDPPVNIPVHPMKNWLIVHVTVRHLQQNQFWFTAPNDNADSEPGPSTSASTLPQAIATPRQLHDDIPSFPSFNARQISMFLEELFPDCELICTLTADTFRVHKSILSVHSIVFRSMFGHRFTLESQSSRVEIPDYDPEAVLIMVQWFYTGSLQSLDVRIQEKYLHGRPSLGVLDDTLLLQVTELSHKYALDDLAFLCEQTWSERLSDDNVCDLLLVADLFHLYSLKMSCTALVRENRHVLGTEAWGKVTAGNPTLAQHILDNL
ncbi:speckle-type POZ protein B-like protein [Aphelenchoides avenae]|nr:speckle-type POZ protein B-like protein [Aphelenchus avenae]